MAGMFKYLAYDYIPNPNSIFKNITKLDPGHFAVLSNGRLEKRRYWNIKFDESREIYDVREYGQRFKDLKE